MLVSWDFPPRTAARLAEIKDIPFAELERATTANFRRLFGKVPPP